MTEPGHPQPDVDSRTILRRFSHLLGATWLRDGLQALFLVYLARKSATTYGQFMVAMSLGQILLFVSEFGINQRLVSLLVNKEADDAAIMNRATALKAVLLSLGCLGMMGFIVWQGYPPELKAVVLALGIGVGLEALASSFFVSCQVRGRQDLEAKVRMTSTLIGFGYGITVLLFGLSPYWVALFKLVESVSSIAGMVLVARHSMRFRLRWPRFPDLWQFGRASMDFTLLAMTTMLYNKANLFFLQRFGGADGVAQYSATWQIVDWISCAVSNLLLRNVLFPLLAAAWQEDRTRFVRVARDSVAKLLVVACPLVFLLFVESDRIIPFAYGPGYDDAIWMQKILVVTIVISFVHNLAGYMIMSMRKERLLLTMYLIGLVSNLFFCSTLIPAEPLMGTVQAIVFTRALVAVMTVGYCQLRLRLIPLQPLLHVGLALALGGGAYFLLHGRLTRELSEAVAVAPVLGLAWHWLYRLPSGRRREPVAEIA